VSAASPAEWGAAVSFAVMVCAPVGGLFLLTVDAEVWAWPRPLVAAVDRARPVVWDVARSERLYPLLREWDNARHTVRLIPQRAAVTVAAFLLLFTAPEATR